MKLFSGIILNTRRFCVRCQLKLIFLLFQLRPDIGPPINRSPHPSTSDISPPITRPPLPSTSNSINSGDTTDGTRTRQSLASTSTASGSSSISDQPSETLHTKRKWVVISRCLLSCQPRVTVTSCFVNKVIRDLESIDHLCINPIHRIGLIYKRSVDSH